MRYLILNTKNKRYLYYLNNKLWQLVNPFNPNKTDRLFAIIEHPTDDKVALMIPSNKSYRVHPKADPNELVDTVFANIPERRKEAIRRKISSSRGDIGDFVSILSEVKGMQLEDSLTKDWADPEDVV